MDKQNPRRVEIHTDGGCDPNPGVGGWAVVLNYGDARKELSGAESKTTNNRMELQAAIEGLQALKRTCRVHMYTDSEYLKRGITEWIHKWKKAGWRRGRQPLKNSDLWQQLDALCQRHEVEWHWVPAHSGIVENERCDELVREARARLRSGSGP